MMYRTKWFMGFVAVTAVCIGGLQRLDAALTGQWDFNNTGNPLAQTVGQPLSYYDGAGGPTELGTRVGTTTLLGLPNIGGQPATVMLYPKCDANMGYYVVPGVPAAVAGGKAEVYTMVMDILFPTNGVWRGLLQIDDVETNPNTTDADLFVSNGNAIGTDGNYSGTIASNTWYRIAFVKNGATLRKYIDGIKVGEQTLGGNGARWSLSAAPQGVAILFTDNNGETSTGAINSLQFYDAALSDGQVRALGGPQAAGLPQTLPDIPSFVESWIPVGGFARPNTDVGAVLNAGSSVVSNFVLTLDGTALTASVTSTAEVFTIKAAVTGLPLMSDHTLVLTYGDSKAGIKSATNTFRVPLFLEDFDLLTLGPSFPTNLGGEPNSRSNVWTKTAPTGWTIDDSQMPPAAMTNTAIGRPEWEGWAFADVFWWSRFVDMQLRENFTKARGAAAIADPDEWDDYGNPDGTAGCFNSFLITPSITLPGLPAAAAFLRFDSSWRPEGLDDASPPNGTGPATNNQTATITVSYNGGAAQEILYWQSISTNANYHPDNVNETVTIPLNNPAGTSSIVLKFGLTKAANDWWWAVDNIVVDTGPTPPVLDPAQPADTVVGADSPATLSVQVTQGSGPFTYQWYKGQGTNKVALTGETATSKTFAQAKRADSGYYSAEVKNSAGTVFSREARLVVTNRVNVATLLAENFNSVPLGPNVEEGIITGSGPTNTWTGQKPNVWTKTTPAGWSIDDTGVPGIGTTTNGVVEWAGWSFADPVWWSTSCGDQNRSRFTKATGAAAIADGDEWDDQPRLPGLMTTYLKTKTISLAGVLPDTMMLQFDSSWRPEPIQKAVITASFNGGAAVEVMRWDSDEANINFHTDSENETVYVLVNNPANATNVVFNFGYVDAGNNWWWAIDNVFVTGTTSAPQNLGTISYTVAGGNLNMTWTGGTGIRLQNAGNLNSPITWTDVAGTEGTSAKSVPIGTGVGYYRLFKP